jgi:CHAT domain-containing protein
LAFAGVNSNAPYLGDLDTSNDGVLTALEVLGLNLGGTQLVVLSACETGLGEIHEGEGVYGLRRAFKEAGVQEIVMSLWAVSDAGTQALMSAMYERLLAGNSPRDSLRGAQRYLMEDPRWGYPYIWAAFTIVGK